MRVKTLTPLFTVEQIDRRVRELAGQINALYTGRQLVLICVLKGAFMFFSDLVKYVTVSVELDFVRLASYGGSSFSSGVTFSKDVEISLAGKDVVLVEDIVDSGHTMDFLLRRMKAYGANSLRVAALVDKVERREVPVQLDFVAFPLLSGFIVGYGLDYAERYRELPAIYTATLEE
ncbi:MAG: hypoxanthine phosphoribosyltransferase [Desulfovibrio sp.]|jgi:hypoxanthine phosphoribosyltransferase|nr:hypoxanthine phosphoribosyltransferase [Desulfovibrio sp.]